MRGSAPIQRGKWTVHGACRSCFSLWFLNCSRLPELLWSCLPFHSQLTLKLSRWFLKCFEKQMPQLFLKAKPSWDGPCLYKSQLLFLQPSQGALSLLAISFWIFTSKSIIATSSFCWPQMGEMFGGTGECVGLFKFVFPINAHNKSITKWVCNMIKPWQWIPKLMECCIKYWNYAFSPFCLLN